MKGWHLFGLVLVTGLLLAIFSNLRQASSLSRTEIIVKNSAPKSRVERWSAEAEEHLRETLTNDVVGFRRTMQSCVLMAGSDNPTNWTGLAEVEFVNSYGGIQRTNLRFLFWVSMDRVLARVESRHETIERWRSEADQKVRESFTKYLTNRLIGFDKIASIDVSGDYSSADPSKWRAKSRVKFVNGEGVVESTILTFMFLTSSHYIFADHNFMVEAEEYEAKLRDDLARDLAGLKSDTDLELEALRLAHVELDRRIDANTVAGPRTWTFLAGGKVEGTLIKVQGTNGVVVTRVADGQQYTLLRNQLSLYDNFYLETALKIMQIGRKP
jgi:hypothetical protein